MSYEVVILDLDNSEALDCPAESRRVGLEVRNRPAPMGNFAAPSVQSQGAGDVVSEADGEPDPQHWGTGGSYILGGAGINSDLDKVNPKILDLSLGTSFPDMGKTGKGGRRCPR
ncbi:hypothetical protein OCS_04209 [Ophiocordyceps sinensis CO18]|uniref:Uncharacterized protein n=1 Tax=Ophiocordyceps sinensis (strain Co18 / CGMCC 3.14243) TaxID=911162 RepID=T5ACD1_OPHSC|nr:hypothetical protein OCS_04209 [Ophiocordyceps sinensis CO18]